MTVLIFVTLAASASLVAWWLLVQADRAWTCYEDRLRNETRRTLDASFLFLDMAQLRPVAAALGLILMLTVAWLAGRWWGVLPVLAGLVCMPPLILRHMRHRRARRFDAQLPDLLQALAGALRAGAGVQPALRRRVAQSGPPLSQEFGLMLREQRLGLGFQDALLQLRIRMPTESCGLVVSALGIASRTGGIARSSCSSAGCGSASSAPRCRARSARARCSVRSGPGHHLGRLHSSVSQRRAACMRTHAR